MEEKKDNRAKGYANLIPYKKGQSGNPNGRPKKIPEIDKLLAEVLGDEDGEDAKEILIALVLKAKKGDVRAAEVLLDRAYGKAKQQISGNITKKIIFEFGTGDNSQNLEASSDTTNLLGE